MATQEPDPAMATQEPDHAMATQKPDPAMATQEPDPAMATQEPDPAMATQKPDPAMATQKPDPAMATQKPDPGMATQEPDPAMATQKPDPAMATQEPDPAMATQKPDPAMATQESEAEPKESYPDPFKLPMRSLERQFWKRKLPPSFRFHLKGLSRELMLNETDDINQHAADFFSELQQQRDEELQALPQNSYLDKLLQKKGLEKERPSTPKLPPEVLNPIRCARCGRMLNPKAQHAPAAGEPLAGQEITHMEGDDEIKVIALAPNRQDAFGRLVCDCPDVDEECGDLVTRSLAYLVDY